ncbi:LysR family transcriptional regulator [Paraburkholderia sp. CNPSo 3076]|uniref:LysR family transcriptional regulator n=1 Tax=Paraburkholderia sp. CNPSo 3076 TaxID=2940936 RepID=UPI002251A748|nr:LysR family transcriptional regulator [Paraburkholderia sp. CNPSo 3076]MCX5542144.1 LysR family transcriptional regulator [Paraburkholderia sp. CNPSo 3076]
MPARKQGENWDDLRYFLAVARAGTLSAAAERLGTEHTTVSRHIQSLERELEDRLFHKSNAGYVLTPAGERLLQTAESIESAWLLSKASTGANRQQLQGVVRVGVPDGFASIFLAPKLHELTNLHPLLEVELFAAPQEFSLWKGEVDIAVGLSGAEHLRVASRRLTDYRMFVYGSRSYLAQAEPIRVVKDLERHPFVGYVEEGLFAPELDYIDVVSDQLVPRIRSSALLPQVFATLAGNALGILPAYIASFFPTLVRVLPDEIVLTRSFHMHVHQDHRKAAHIREVANFIADAVRRNARLFMGESI